MTIRTYSELKQLETFEERYRYLRLQGRVGEATFGYDRFLNQNFYRSTEWRRIRPHVIARDLACDLGIADNEIRGKILIHHMNPLTPEDLEEGLDSIIDPEFLICVSHNTHNAIHYGDEKKLPKPFIERRPGDTAPWRHPEDPNNEHRNYARAG